MPTDPMIGVVTATIAAVAAAMVVVIREVLNFFRQRNGAKAVNNSSGAQPTAFWTEKIRQTVVEGIEIALRGDSRRQLFKEITDQLEKGRGEMMANQVRMLDRLERMTEDSSRGRQILVDKLDQVLAAVLRRNG